MKKTQEKKSALKQRALQLSFFSSVFILSVMFQNCSVVSSSRNESDESSVSQSSLLTSKAMGILANKCARCHNPNNAQGQISDITDINYLLYYRLVIPGQPDVSDIVRVIREGTMPPDGSAMTVDELDTLSKWIQSGILDEGGGVILPGGSAPLTATYSSLYSRIFSPRCTGCHNAANMDGGVDLSSYNSIRNIALSANNRLYVSVTTKPNRMPQGGNPLSPEELQRLSEWIAAGAQNN